MIVPNADRAFVDDAKLLDYCLDPQHLRGRNKARLFDELLGINRRNMLVQERAARGGSVEYGKPREKGYVWPTVFGGF